ncbi:MAG TPA: biopolymer transporter ExbD [Planctomycetota bacterium]|nr:biopolymer transporter ExbD [Planctomycetota bacterium]
MFQSIRNREDRSSAALVDIAPLIDVVFILLIFFLVTATFVRDTGVSVDRPRAVATRTLEPTSFRVSVTKSDAIYADGRQVTLDELQAKVRELSSRQRDASVIVIPDREVPSGRLIEVMDAARIAGASDVAVATTQERRR